VFEVAKGPKGLEAAHVNPLGEAPRVPGLPSPRDRALPLSSADCGYTPALPGGPMLPLKAAYRRLCLASNAELARAYAGGVVPDADALAGWEFYGYNTAAIAGPLGIRKFKKGFYRRESGRTPHAGYNCKVRPTPLDGPWENGGPGGAYQGYYDVKPPGTGAAVDPAPNALYLDYGANPDNTLLEGSFLRDFIVQPDPAEPDVLLGKAYAKLGPVVVPVSFFVLQRAHRSTQPASLLGA
jgi:hypothetical protein